MKEGINYGIIAAGEGSRLVEEGILLPKPLVKLNGVSLIDRLIAVFQRNNAASISIIVNQEMKEVQDHLAELKLDIPLNLVVHSTPSSMHSFFELSRFLQNGKFCLTTVDTVFKEDEFSGFIQTFIADQTNDGMMAVTDFIDDESPLYVSVSESDMQINGFLDRSGGAEKYVSGGIYCLSDNSINILRQCLDDGVSRMRNYQRALITNNLKLKAYPFKKIVDVDHAEDIRKAEVFLLS